MLYPFVMEPAYKKYLWGGRNLEKWGKNLPEGNVAEAWEASAHPDGLSLVANGVFAGKTLKDVIDAYPEEVLGKTVSGRYENQLPLLFKLIDASDRLSVQVHPDDAYAREKEGQPFGKYEAWYVLEAAPDATIVYGLTPGTNPEGFEEAVQKNSIADCLKTAHVREGDMIEVKPGTVHAIGSGIVLAELQQNSNLTYRVYDYGRLDAQGNPRALHVRQALEVIDFEAGSDRIVSTYGMGQYKKASGLRNEYFTVEAVDLKKRLAGEELGGLFRILFICEGKAEIRYAGGSLCAGRGKTVFVPAALGHYAVSGRGRILRMSVAAPQLRKRRR